MSIDRNNPQQEDLSIIEVETNNAQNTERSLRRALEVVSRTFHYAQNTRRARERFNPYNRTNNQQSMTPSTETLSQEIRGRSIQENTPLQPAQQPRQANHRVIRNLFGTAAGSNAEALRQQNNSFVSSLLNEREFPSPEQSRQSSPRNR